MEKPKRNSRNGIYWLLLILSLIVGYVFYVSLQGKFSLQFLVFFSGVPFLLFVTGILGLLWTKLKPVGEELYIGHALLIGLLFIILFFFHVWLILPRVCPDFGACLGV